jgi:hypothetical protein
MAWSICQNFRRASASDIRPCCAMYSEKRTELFLFSHFKTAASWCGAGSDIRPRGAIISWKKEGNIFYLQISAEPQQADEVPAPTSAQVVQFILKIRKNYGVAATSWCYTASDIRSCCAMYIFWKIWKKSFIFKLMRNRNIRPCGAMYSKNRKKKLFIFANFFLLQQAAADMQTKNGLWKLNLRSTACAYQCIHNTFQRIRGFLLFFIPILRPRLWIRPKRSGSGSATLAQTY